MLDRLDAGDVNFPLPVGVRFRGGLVDAEEEWRGKYFLLAISDMLLNWECFDSDSGKDLGVELREYFIPDFSNWNDQKAFEFSFNKLLADLKAMEVASYEGGSISPLP